MRLLQISLVVAVMVLVTGCQSPAGTWTAEAGSSPIARATFANDGTFTAEADYGQGKVRAMSGYYTMKDGKLKMDLGDQHREYDAKVVGDKLEMSYKGKTETMNRMKPKCCCCKSGDCKK